MKNKKILPPFAYFGSKRAVADIIWKGLGSVTNYVEPFCGSLAVLLANPSPAKIETINDVDHGLANFWRAVSINPEEVAKHAEYLVSEIDIHARHRFLVSEASNDFKEKMLNDPEFYDAKYAGWWVYGQSASIMGNWLQQRGLNAIPLLSAAGGGIHGLRHNTLEWFKTLQERTKRVRVCCGDWTKIVTPAVTFKNKSLVTRDITGVFLDPPYDLEGRVKKIYQQDQDIFSQVCQWAIENGDNPKMRIVLCGYDGDHGIPDNWQTYHWISNGGMANQALGDSTGKTNKDAERIWFSPHCLKLDEDK